VLGRRKPAHPKYAVRVIRVQGDKKESPGMGMCRGFKETACREPLQADKSVRDTK
jgi:hypothetical protein